MTGPDLLVLYTLASIGLLLVLILYVRMHAFLAMLVTSIGLGLACGMEPAKLLKSIQSGFGEALGFIAVVVALGSIMGRYIEYSGGGRALAEALLAKFGKDRAVWAVLTASFLVGLPIFFEVGFIILLPLALSLGRESKRSLLYFGLPIACALTVTHAMVPPHPAPAAAAQLLGADLGLIILYGAMLSVPMTIAGGVIYGLWIAKRLYIPAPADKPETSGEQDALPPPNVWLVAVLLTLPVLLIFASTIASRAGAGAKGFLTLIGHPFCALAIAAFASMYFLGTRRGLDREAVTRMATQALAPTASLLVIMGGGGAFKQVIVDSGVGAYAGKMLAASNISPLVLAWVVAAGMRVAQGSATVAIITAAGIVAPLVKGIPGYSSEMIVLALCAGGTILSHVNDAGFWLVNQSFGMTVPQTLRSWTVMKVVTSMVGLAIVLAAQALFGK
ncbi:MAG: gluconate transporter [Acidobacteria bacterium]|nr:gluconate transporter [Acidobacteriota bacterium]